MSDFLESVLSITVEGAVVGALSLGPTQVLGMGMIIYSAGETAFLAAKIGLASLKNRGKHEKNDRKNYLDPAKANSYSQVDKSYFKNEMIKAQSIWLKKVTSQRALHGALGMIPLFGPICLFGYGYQTCFDNESSFISSKRVRALNKILDNIENSTGKK